MCLAARNKHPFGTQFTNDLSMLVAKDFTSGMGLTTLEAPSCAKQRVLAAAGIAASHEERAGGCLLLKQFTHQPLFESTRLCLKIYGALLLIQMNKGLS